MKFDYHSIDLPVKDIIPEVKSLLDSNNTLIVNAPPGAGKSTLLPLVLLDENFLGGKKILMLEPRRLAAKTIAWRMSDLIGENVGETIGYRIRFESQISSKTRIEVVTEGILTRMLHADNALEEVGMVIFDEFHERNIHADIAMALCREVQQVLRPDLRILVMSATLDMPQLTNLLKAPAVKSEGKSYPVEQFYVGDIDLGLLSEMVSKTIIEASKKHGGDILAFLPGQGEIKDTESILRKLLPGFSIHPLYGLLSPQAQHQAIFPNKHGKRKVVLATSIAETSLTIEGIEVVVDSGFGRTSKFNPRTGLSKLETIRISKDSADQRSGRAGRLGPGVCYRMWSRHTHSLMAEYRTPEILEADLAFLVLDMVQWGTKDIQFLTWLTPPPTGHLSQAFDLLHEINALEAGKITSHGKKIHAIPAHPRIAHMLLMAEKINKSGLACDIAALLEERDPLEAGVGVDINLRLEALRRARKEDISIKGINKIEKIARQYRKMLQIEAENGFVDPFETGLLIAYAYPERIAYSRPGNNAQFQLANGKIVAMGHRDDLAHESWLAVSHVDARDGIGKIFLASPLNPKDLLPMVKEKKIIKWDKRNGELQAVTNLCLGSIILKSTPLKVISEDEKSTAILEAIRTEGMVLLDFNEATTQLQNRVNSLRIWNKDQNWPDFNTSNLLENAGQWLRPYLAGVRKAEDLFKLNLVDILHNSLDFDQQRLLGEIAPKKLTVPSGSLIAIQYFDSGEKPVLAVRLQEVFGWLDTPTINSGKTPLLLHLLSPGFKPVQVTSDLRSFWMNTYFEVKKELKRRYPKHSWPEEPLQAEAVRGVKRK
ncbi:ATP-dependent helicase HrpB [Cognataquiflexum rubidum]|uniref:ATP-dependent helicase HrpB n=1 Tax=Cognataquiflexum rubidum TaxID=2922273 RepID=UPI001F148D58|nr:ATP-dependent helicase HrpB [Cognataquiflexum rubidum]MCH6236428.1 ATP-dependent helicase HrpB [Cognataquiflexum rubidum]